MNILYSTKPIYVKVNIGSNINSAIKAAIELASDFCCSVILTFNDKEIILTRSDTVEIKVLEYMNS